MWLLCYVTNALASKDLFCHCSPTQEEFPEPFCVRLSALHVFGLRQGAGPVEVMQDETKWAIPAGGRSGIGAAAPDCHKLSCRVRGVVVNCCARLAGRCRLQSGSLSRGCREEVGRPPKADGCLLASAWSSWQKGLMALGRGSALSLRP